MAKPLVNKDDLLLRYEDIEKILTVSRSTIFRMIRNGEFPAPIRISGGTSRWRMSDVKAWVRSCKPDKKGK
jgi:prophage regulatory protein